MIDKAECIRLREREEAQVQQFYATLRAEDPEARMVHLPTLLPLKPVPYIVVSAEPSLSFAKDKSDWGVEAMVAGGYRNFMHSWEDFHSAPLPQKKAAQLLCHQYLKGRFRCPKQ